VVRTEPVGVVVLIVPTAVSQIAAACLRYSDRNRLRRMVNSQAHMFVPGWNELMLPMARRRVFLHEVVRTVDYATE
jgi:hypothetical protein